MTDRANNFGLAVAGGLMMIPSFAFGGERTDAPSGSPQALEAGAQMQKLVNALSGRWSINKTDANGTTAHGEEMWRTGAGGLAISRRIPGDNLKRQGAGGLCGHLVGR